MTPLIDQFPEGRLTREAEAALAEEIQAGSEAAQNDLVIATMRQALLYTRRTCDGKIRESERTSLCYQRLMRAAKRFDPARGRFFAFAKAALRGTMKTYWEDQGVVRNAEEIVSLENVTEDQPKATREMVTGEITQPEFDVIFARDEWAELLKKSGHRLDSQHRQVLSLIYRGGLNGPEIGKLMGVSRSRVHAIHREALQIMRDILGRNEGLLERA